MQQGITGHQIAVTIVTPNLRMGEAILREDCIIVVLGFKLLGLCYYVCEISILRRGRKGLSFLQIGMRLFAARIKNVVHERPIRSANGIKSVVKWNKTVRKTTTD